MKLDVSDLAFGYPGFPVGQDVSLHLEAGEVLCLLGPNGCGKTTLFKTVMGLLPPRGGRIAIGGRAMESLARPELARLMAYVPQAHAPVFPYSVHDMVLMGRTAHRGLFAAPSKGDHEAALAALEQLEIADLATRDYTRLSGGQRQLVLIARALAQESPFILLDEPTASLDFGNQLMVLEQVRRLAADGKGIVMSTHDPDHAFACGTRALAMKDGRTLANGPVAETLTGEVLSSLYDVPVEILLAGERRICLPAI
ncbi:ABC transporter ATP-binding protein [Denitrobaculum tricleocarpae]|uniref:ABC transporter ATP-binding protein n=1 Tax=Denitrobaculum tricleocarpae TaxID=2591009 RepID=A0A545TKU6_9PROT|nr:ABC transporter ATP-binding protein [Denitrobaculum tricleocarpae]TQV77827.1 ABC transporter ATP-binding protein [Denitrobaculum tricleocarpae]